MSTEHAPERGPKSIPHEFAAAWNRREPRRPDGWRCVSAHNTDVVPGAETNVVDERGRIGGADYRLE